MAPLIAHARHPFGRGDVEFGRRGPITWQLAMSSPFNEPVPSPGGLSEPLGRPDAGTDIPGPGLAISGVSRTYETDDGPVPALGPVELACAAGPLCDPHRSKRLR